MMYIENAITYIKNVYSKTDKAHDFQHAIRVFNNAKMICTNHKTADVETVYLSALLHDIVDEKLFANENLLDEWFRQYPSEKEKKIRNVISEISFSKGKKPTSIEAMIVQDADRLDAIGAIGIARVFTYGGSKGRPIYSESEPSSVSHFDEKLFKILDLINTEEVKSIARNRTQYMHEFIERLNYEIEGKI